MQRPRGLSGRWAARTLRGSAAATAASKSARNAVRARASSHSMRGRFPNRRVEYGESGRRAPCSGLDQGGAEMGGPTFDDATRTELEAAAYRRLVQHLRERTDVQNIDLMNLAGFCRNCLSRWYREAAESKGIGLADPDAREIVYGMPYKEWQAKHQKAASTEQTVAVGKANPGH